MKGGTLPIGAFCAKTLELNYIQNGARFCAFLSKLNKEAAWQDGHGNLCGINNWSAPRKLKHGGAWRSNLVKLHTESNSGLERCLLFFLLRDHRHPCTHIVSKARHVNQMNHSLPAFLPVGSTCVLPPANVVPVFLPCLQQKPWQNCYHKIFECCSWYTVCSDINKIDKLRTSSWSFQPGTSCLEWMERACWKTKTTPKHSAVQPDVIYLGSWGPGRRHFCDLHHIFVLEFMLQAWPQLLQLLPLLYPGWRGRKQSPVDVFRDVSWCCDHFWNQHPTCKTFLYNPPLILWCRAATLHFPRCSSALFLKIYKIDHRNMRCWPQTCGDARTEEPHTRADLDSRWYGCDTRSQLRCRSGPCMIIYIYIYVNIQYERFLRIWWRWNRVQCSTVNLGNNERPNERNKVGVHL